MASFYLSADRLKCSSGHRHFGNVVWTLFRSQTITESVVCCFSIVFDLEVHHTLPPLLPHSCLWICVEFPVDRVSHRPSFSPSLVNVTSIVPMRSEGGLSPERSGMEALGGKVSSVNTRGSLLYPSWTLPPGHCHLLLSSFKVCMAIHSLEEYST